MKELNLDEVFDIIGHFGRGQVLYFVVIILISLFTAFHMVLNIFTGLEPHFYCWPILPNAIINITSSLSTHNSVMLHTNELNDSLFKAPISGTSPEPLRDACPNNNPDLCRIIYDVGYKSFVQEWGLVCSKKYLVATVQSVWTAGILVGSLLLSGLADKYGRNITAMIAGLGTIAFEGLSGFTTHYSSYLVSRFFGGVLYAALVLALYTLSQEIVGSSKRSLASLLTAGTFSFGIMILSAMAASVENWSTLTLLVSAVGVPLIPLMFLLPESPRWLVTTGHTEEAMAALETIARLNGKKLPPGWVLVSGLVDSKKLQEDDRKHGRWLEKQKRKSKAVRKVIHKVDVKSSGLRDLVKHRYIVEILLIQIYSWFVNGIVYYGLTLSASSLGSNAYASTALNGLVEVPAIIMSLILVERLGRRILSVGLMAAGGVACMLVMVMPAGVVTTLALFGKLCISASFSVIYIQSGEIFPTSVRNTGLGILSVGARVGGIVSPFLIMLGDIAPGLQFAVMGLLSFTAGVVCLRLPETMGRRLPDTVQDMLAFNSKVSLHPHHYSAVELAESDAENGIMEVHGDDDKKLLLPV